MRLPLRLLAYVLPVMVLLSSCDSTDGDPLDQTEPFENNGTSTIELVPNQNSYSVGPGQKVILSLKITKGASGNRPQKLRLYETSTVGTKEREAFQKIDLKNVDSQTKTIEYTAPTTNGTTYLYFEVDESGDKYKTTYVTVIVSGTVAIAEWNNIELGAQNDAKASRFASASGQIYAVCDILKGVTAEGDSTDGNLKYVDILYRITPKDNPAIPTLMSNPQSITDGFAKTTTQCDGTPRSVEGGSLSYFATTTADYATADADALKALTVSSSSAQKIAVVKGGTYAFLNADNKKGLIKVNDITGSAADINAGKGTINISVKVLR
ncbi:hypothetical protein QNI19_00005 [Cytophagaceae bacterium DM2B3-1]|uniref:Lipoprotein n=2 Tax=Xanthocytophaga flava TaxID=3048013 RepID=A0ABT7CCR3_9BACT|nr:hypothetical protein [Xanthocytophaga flavus]MDJ1470151.1 hypothetical protein [Xanthocytophaga flavus]MDJ1491286.1 hypothetical protein [Xanthocytophaga flavus]